MVIVQRITTAWTKTSRGAHGREERARLPRAYALPRPDQSTACFFHEVSRWESEHYAVREYSVSTERPTTRRGGESASAVVIELAEGIVRVSLRGDTVDSGKPARRSLAPVELGPGQTALVRFNGRFVGHEGNWYEDKIIHVAHATELVPDIFCKGPPVATLDALVDLW